MLLELAAQHDARDLKQIGKRILDVVAPEVGESHEADALQKEEARAAAGVELTLTDDGEGRCHGRFTVPSHVGAMLRRHLLALANPARHTEAELRDESGDWKSLRRRLGEAFVEYVERYPVEAAPQTAGVNATVVVTMTLEQLLADQATALLDDGSRMSAGQARRLACEAGIIPVVLGARVPAARPGTAARLFTKAQRTALGLRDGGCTARGCETSRLRLPRPPRRSVVPGRLTDLANGRLLCPRHHRLAHDSRYAMTVHADNQVSSCFGREDRRRSLCRPIGHAVQPPTMTRVELPRRVRIRTGLADPEGRMRPPDVGMFAMGGATRTDPLVG